MARIFFMKEDPDDVGIDKVEDNDPIPFGKHEGTLMKDVPADYLIWMNDNLVEREGMGQKLRDDERAVLNYIQANLESIEADANQEGGSE